MISDQGTLSSHRLVLPSLLRAPAPWPRWDATRSPGSGACTRRHPGRQKLTSQAPPTSLPSKTFPPCPRGNIQRSGQSRDLLPLSTPSAPPSDIPALFVLQGRLLNWGEARASSRGRAAAFGCYESCIHNTAASDIIDPAGAKALKSLRNTHTQFRALEWASVSINKCESSAVD